MIQKLTGLVLHQCIPVPDINKPQSTHSFAMTCIWIHLNRKAQNDNSKLQIPIPHSLKLHHEFVPTACSLPPDAHCGVSSPALGHFPLTSFSSPRQVPAAVAAQQNPGHGGLQDRSALQRLQHQLGVLHAAHGRPGGDHLRQRLHEDQPAGHQLHGLGLSHPAAHEPARLAHGACQDEVGFWKEKKTQWLKTANMDSNVCFVPSASSLIHSIATRVIKLAHAKSSNALAPALVETYSRLLVYMEIESLGIKGFISESQTLSQAYQPHGLNNWHRGITHSVYMPAVLFFTLLLLKKIRQHLK